ncbi:MULTISPECIES: helix-turn-helix domain-containing protein [unclassified Streptomyces]|nr:MULTISPECIES: helix-turn-helix transcriptional regulator [unclassified Streptomyces]
MERGQRNLSLHNILKLAEILGVDPGELVRGLRPPAADADGTSSGLPDR